MKKIYIASPYTIGDTAHNVRRQMAMADRLISEGFAPFVPLYYHFQHMHRPRDYEDWMRLDMAWLNSCDALLRLEGESAGADREALQAIEWEIPVYYSLTELLRYEKDDVV